MIKIRRGLVPTGTLFDKKGRKNLEQIELHIQSNSSVPWRKYDLWRRDKTIKGFLYDSQHGKCCYCEKHRAPSRETGVEHFRPKSASKRDNHKGYWWLAYEWNNLLISCSECNAVKLAKFPLRDEKNRCYNKSSDLNKEEPFLIDPLKEDPENFIEYDIQKGSKNKMMIKAIGKCERGNKTVELTGINSTETLQERYRIFEGLKPWLSILNQKGIPQNITDMAKKEIKRYCKCSSPFSGFARFYIKKMEIAL